MQMHFFTFMKKHRRIPVQMSSIRSFQNNLTTEHLKAEMLMQDVSIYKINSAVMACESM